MLTLLVSITPAYLTQESYPSFTTLRRKPFFILRSRSSALNEIADITDGNLVRKVDRSKHLCEEYPPIRQCISTSLISTKHHRTYHPAKQARKAKAPDAICSFVATSECPMAICQYDPVRRTKHMKRPKKMVTKTMLVRRAQIRYIKLMKPMNNRKKAAPSGRNQQSPLAHLFMDAKLTEACVEPFASKSFVRLRRIRSVSAVRIVEWGKCTPECEPKPAWDDVRREELR